MNDEIQNEIEAKGLSAPRVTPADVEAEIASEHFFTGHEGAVGAYHCHHGRHQGTPANEHNVAALSLLTFCVLVLRNGFTVTGESACASAENFDAEIGRKIARQKAVDKVWALLGFRLLDEISRGEHTA